MKELYCLGSQQPKFDELNQLICGELMRATKLLRYHNLVRLH